MMRKASTIGVVTLALGLGITGQASARPSDPPSCFGQFAATFATGEPQALGTFVSEAAAFFNETGGSMGQVGVPLLKGSCAS
jgi:ABC-type transporter Mla subunit MlaD